MKNLGPISDQWYGVVMHPKIITPELLTRLCNV